MAQTPTVPESGVTNWPPRSPFPPRAAAGSSPTCPSCGLTPLRNGVWFAMSEAACPILRGHRNHHRGPGVALSSEGCCPSRTCRAAAVAKKASRYAPTRAAPALYYGWGQSVTVVGSATGGRAAHAPTRIFLGWHPRPVSDTN
eukprot:EG_transcript_24614